MCGGGAPDQHSHSPWVKVELLALAHCVSGRSESGNKNQPTSKIEGVCGRHHSFHNWRNKALVTLAQKDLKQLQREAVEKGLRLSITEGGKGKSRAITSCKLLEEMFQECSKTEGVVFATSVETLGVDLRIRTNQLGAKEKARRKKCDVRFSIIRKNRPSRNIHEDCCESVAEDGIGPSRAWEDKPWASRLQKG